MGGKESKGTLPSLADLRESGMSREELAAYLSSVSDMVETGHNRNPALPEIRVNNQPVNPPAAPAHGDGHRSSARGQLRHKLEKQLSAEKPAEHVSRQLQLLDGLDSQDDSRDWAHMRDWLLYHMHENLDDDSDDDTITASPSISSHQAAAPRGGRRMLQRQMSMDKGRITQRLRLTHQGSSSASSSSGGRTSYQSSFDSTGTGGGDT